MSHDMRDRDAIAEAAKAHEGATQVATPWRSADLGAQVEKIATRLPAGLTEAELAQGYALCAGGAS